MARKPGMQSRMTTAWRAGVPGAFESNLFSQSMRSPLLVFALQFGHRNRVITLNRAVLDQQFPDKPAPARERVLRVGSDVAMRQRAAKVDDRDLAFAAESRRGDDAGLVCVTAYDVAG